LPDERVITASGSQVHIWNIDQHLENPFKHKKKKRRCIKDENRQKIDNDDQFFADLE